MRRTDILHSRQAEKRPRKRIYRWRCRHCLSTVDRDRQGKPVRDCKQCGCRKWVFAGVV